MTANIALLNGTLEPDGKGYVFHANVRNDERDTVEATWTFTLVLNGSDGVEYQLDEQVVSGPLPFGQSVISTAIGGLTRVSQDASDGALLSVTIQAIGTITPYVEAGEAVQASWAKTFEGPDCNIMVNHNGRVVASFWPA